MILRIKSVRALPDYTLAVIFDDGRHVIYGVKADMRDIPSYRELCEVSSLFAGVQLDTSRTCVFLTEEIDLPSDVIYEYGVTLS